MKFIPAIDLLNNEVVRLFQGDYSRKTSYQTSALEMLRKYENVGCKRIHIVDLAAAREGKPVHLAILKELAQAKKKDTILEWGGGLRDFANLESAHEAGADKLILGTALIKNPALLDKSIKAFGAEKIVAGVDARDGMVQISGWEKGAAINAVKLIQDMEKAGAGEVIFTDIAADGTLEGPVLSSLEEVLKNTKIKVIASGGIGCLEDLQSIKNLENKYPDRIEGIIVGRAIYDGKIDLEKAVELCNT